MIFKPKGVRDGRQQTKQYYSQPPHFLLIRTLCCRHNRHHSLLSKWNSLDLGKPSHPWRSSGYSTRVYTLRVFGLSCEHTQSVGPYSRRLQRQRGHHGKTSWSQIWTLRASSTLSEPSTTKMLVVNVHGMNTTLHVAWRLFWNVQPTKWTGSGCWLLRYRITVNSCTRYQFSHAAYVHSTKPSESLSVCALAWVFVSLIHALMEQRSSQEKRTDWLVKEASVVPFAATRATTWIWRALKCADVNTTKEPTGLLRVDRKRSNWLTLMLWKSERSLTWDFTVVDTLAALKRQAPQWPLWKREKYQHCGRKQSTPTLSSRTCSFL